MLHQLDAWHQEQATWRIAMVERIERTIEGANDHTTGHATLTN